MSDELSRQSGGPWQKPMGVELRGGLRGQVSQNSDSGSNILRPRNQVQEFRRSSSFAGAGEPVTVTVTQVADRTVTVTTTVTQTETVTLTETITETVVITVTITETVTITIPEGTVTETQTVTVTDHETSTVTVTEFITVTVTVTIP